MINDEGVWLIKRPRGARGARAVQRDPAALGGPHRGRLARRSPTRSSARSTTSASQFPREWPYYLGWNAQHSNAPGHDVLPAGRRQHAPVHQRAADPPVRAARQGAAVHRRLAAASSRPARWSGPRGRRRRSGSSTRSPTSRSAASSACAAASSSPDAPGAAGLARHGAHRPRGVLPDAEPDADGRGAAPRRLGPRRADDPARDGARPGQGPPRPRLPRAQRQAGDVALEALAAGARLAAQLRRHRRRARGPVPAVRHRHGRGRRPGARGEVRRRAARTPTPRSSPRPTRTRRRAETYLQTPPHPPAEAIEYTKEICRYLVETYGRFPAHTDAFHLPGIWVQFSHLEIEYYERFGNPAHTRAPAEGREIWDRR